MKRLLISYDLIRPGQNYDDLLSYLRSYRHTKPLLSVWLIATTKDAGTVRDEIVAQGLIDTNDKLIVVDTTGKAAGWHPSSLPWMLNQEV